MLTNLFLIRNGSGKYITNAAIPVVAYHDDKKDEGFWEDLFIKCFVAACYYETKMTPDAGYRCCKFAPQWATYCPSCGLKMKRNHDWFCDYIQKKWHNFFHGINVDDFTMEMWDYLEECGWQFYLQEFDFKTVDHVYHLEGLSYKFNDEDLIKSIYDEIKLEESKEDSIDN